MKNSLTSRCSGVFLYALPILNPPTMFQWDSALGFDQATPAFLSFLSELFLGGFASALWIIILLKGPIPLELPDRWSHIIFRRSLI